MAEEFVMNEEVVEAAVEAAEEVVTTKPKFSWGKLAFVGAIVGGVAIGATKLVKYVKGKIEAKKVKSEPENEENWVEELQKINEEPIDDLAE